MPINPQKLIEARAKKNWTQQDLASATGLNKKSISRIERGEVEPLPATIYKLAIALDIDPEEFECTTEKFLPEGTTLIFPESIKNLIEEFALGKKIDFETAATLWFYEQFYSSGLTDMNPEDLDKFLKENPGKGKEINIEFTSKKI